MHRTYTQFTIGVAVVWAIVLVLGAIVDRHKFSGTVFDVLLLVFVGFAIGWLLCTIGRSLGNSAPAR